MKTKKTTKHATSKRPPKKPKKIKKSAKDFHRPDYRTDITEDELIRPLDEDLRDAWQALKKAASSLGPQRIYASGWAIMFAKKHCYLFVRPKPKYLETCIFLPHEIGYPEVKSRAVAKNKYANVFRLTHADQVEAPLTDWIHAAFQAMPE